MGRHHGYVYYEADCFNIFVNPFVDLHVENPTMQGMSQKPLKVQNYSINIIINICSNIQFSYLKKSLKNNLMCLSSLKNISTTRAWIQRPSKQFNLAMNL